MIDLRTLSPWDQRDGVRESVKKTNRVIVALRGFALVGLRRRDRGGDRRRVLRVARCAGEARGVARTPSSGYAPQLEDAILPQVDDFKRAYAELMRF